MPEGDTIFRTATRLRPLLQGQTIVAAGGSVADFSVDSLIGRTVTSVEARGKHLLIHTDDSRTVHSHLGMHGAWHVYRPGEAWQKAERLAALVIETAETVCVCFNPKLLEMLTATRLRRHPHLSRLGPDLLAECLDVEAILQRFRVHDPTPIGEAVMNQTIVCGIGNVYKSEVLFLTEVNPFVAVAELSDEILAQIVHSAKIWMTKNLDRSPRQTRFGLDGTRLWVYGRSGKTCFACGQRIRVSRQGDLGRTTFWCPGCQGPERK
jgi:endonuclease-8